MEWVKDFINKFSDDVEINTPLGKAVLWITPDD